MASVPPTGYSAGSSSTTILEYNTAQGTPADTTLAYVKNLTLPSMSRAALETTLVTDVSKQFIAGIMEYGEMNVEIFYDSVNAKSIVVTALLGKSLTWAITFPDTGSLAFDAYLKSVGGAVPEGNELVTQTLTLKLTADAVPVWA